jgi:hypothetical protein
MSKRAGMQPIGEWRAYFAPVNRATNESIRIDAPGEFDLDSPPTPWTELGWIKNLVRSGAVDLEQVATGTSGMNGLRFRKRCEARLEFDFCEWGKLQMALSASSQHINLLAGTAHSILNQDAQSVCLDPQALAEFVVGDLVVVDVDLSGQDGFVGTGVAGAFVKNSASVGADYVRATTFNVAKVKEKTLTALVLERPLIGGVPLNGAKVQKVAGFADREGASFLQEWSGLFILDEVSGGRVMLFFPRLQTAAESGEVREQVCGAKEQLALHAKFVALPIADDLDGESIVSYRYYIPAATAPAY